MGNIAQAKTYSVERNSVSITKDWIYSDSYIKFMTEDFTYYNAFHGSSANYDYNAMREVNLKYDVKWRPSNALLSFTFYQK